MNRPQTRFWLPTWMALVAVVSVFLGLSGMAQLGAVQDVGLCSGDTVLVFTDARLLNVDGQNIAGPYALELSAGTYTVTAGSYDGHDGTQASQPQEQWRVAANSGWLSPFTADVADVAQTSITLFSNQMIAADVSSIELIHLGEGGVNSVSPVCVGFTRVDTESDPGSDTNDSGGDSSDIDDGQTPGSGESVEPDNDSGDADTPADSADPDQSGDPDDSDADTDSDTAIESTDTSSDVTDTSSIDTTSGGDADGSSDTTTNTPTDGSAASGDTTAEDGAAANDTSGDTTTGDDTIEPEVAGIVQEADTLAATGARPITGRVLGLGMLLLGLGGLAVVLTERRHLL